MPKRFVRTPDPAIVLACTNTCVSQVSSMPRRRTPLSKPTPDAIDALCSILAEYLRVLDGLRTVGDGKLGITKPAPLNRVLSGVQACTGSFIHALKQARLPTIIDDAATAPTLSAAREQLAWNLDFHFCKHGGRTFRQYDWIDETFLEDVRRWLPQLRQWAAEEGVVAAQGIDTDGQKSAPNSPTPEEQVQPGPPEIPPLDTESGQWISNKVAAIHESVGVDTLKHYRKQGAAKTRSRRFLLSDPANGPSSITFRATLQWVDS